MMAVSKANHKRAQSSRKARLVDRAVLLLDLLVDTTNRELGLAAWREERLDRISAAAASVAIALESVIKHDPGKPT
jgi:hypothetical protein